MLERNSENQRVQMFLASQQFSRSCEVIETYQKLLEGSKDNNEQNEIIKQRFHEIFDAKNNNQSVDGQYSSLINEFEGMRKQIYVWSENGVFTKEKMAELYARSSIADRILERWNPKIDSKNIDGHIIVNEVLEYTSAGPNDTRISLNIFPTSVKSAGELLQKIREGLKKIATEMENGQLQHIKKVDMTSWLFGPSLERKVKQIFGEDIELNKVSDEEAFETQKLALSYNKRAISEYLLTGKLPPVKSLTMIRGEFIDKFYR